VASAGPSEGYAVTVRKLDSVPDGADPLGELEAMEAAAAEAPEPAPPPLDLDTVFAPTPAVADLELAKERSLGGDEERELALVQRCARALVTRKVDEAIAALEAEAKGGVAGAPSSAAAFKDLDRAVDSLDVLLRGMGMAIKEGGLKGLYSGQASGRQIQRLVRGRVRQILGGADGPNADPASLLALASGGAEAESAAVERLAAIVDLPEKKLERLYEEVVKAEMMAQMGGGGGGGFGGLGGGGGGGGLGAFSGKMDAKAIKELVPVLESLRAMLDAGQIDDATLREVKNQLAKEKADVGELRQGMELLASGQAQDVPPDMDTPEMRRTFGDLAKLLERMQRA